MSAEKILTWIDRVTSLYESEYGDLSFLEDRLGRLKILLNGQAWVLLRFELPSKQFFHLHSIELRNDKAEQIPQANIGLSTSSHYGASLKLLRGRKLLDPTHASNFGFHTLDEHRPWLLMLLSEPTCLGEIIIHNRRGGSAVRAAGMVVSGSIDGVTWEVLYDGGARIRHFRNQVDRIRGEAESDAEEERVREMVLDVILCQYPAARKKFTSDLFPAALRGPVQSALSDKVLPRRQLEWTSHGARRSFRFWSVSEKVEYITLAAELAHDLVGLSEDVCFGFGSVLSAVRNGDLVEHDDDLDLIVGFRPDKAATISEAKRITKKFLEDLGYQVSGNFFSHWHVRCRGQKIDVFVGVYEEGDCIGWFPGRRRALERAQIFPPRLIDLLGVACPVPRDPERYLEVTYGPSWRSPDPGWKHDWDRSSYLDIA